VCGALLAGVAWAEPPDAYRLIAQQGIPINLQKPKQKVDVSPEATGQDRMSPAGNEHGTSEPQRNATGAVNNPPSSPTPPGFPFGPRGGNYAPVGPPASGPVPDTRSLPR
jgi:hypothetical protein